LIEESSLVEENDDILVFLLNENEELIKILAKSISTTKRKNI